MQLEQSILVTFLPLILTVVSKDVRQRGSKTCNSDLQTNSDQEHYKVTVLNP